jgi:hypothetical protein
MHVSLFNPKGPHRVAFVASIPAANVPDAFFVQVAKGPSRLTLGEPKLLGPMTREVRDQIVQRELELLRGEGYVRGGLADLLTRLESKSRSKRALAARRLGLLREPAALEPLLALAGKANEELPVVLDALGELADPLAIPVARAAAERKLLSRRRSGVEALRKLGDKEGLAEAHTRALERMPAKVQAVLATLGTPESGDLKKALLEVTTKDRGLAIDSVYELGAEASDRAVREALVESSFEAPYMWRYTKSVLKRAILRRDAATFGLLAHAIEAKAGHTSGETATVKSGYDGTTKTLRIFGHKTQHYTQRLTWRYLRTLGRYQSEHYAMNAAEVLAHYSDEDASKASGLYGSYAKCYLLGRILYGKSSRFILDERTLRFRLKSAAHAKTPSQNEGPGEAMFPELWEETPLAYVRVLASGLILLHKWALSALETRHTRAIEGAPHAWILGLLSAPYPATVTFGLAELSRRFDRENPDMSLLSLVLHDPRENVRDVGITWLSETAARWALSAPDVLRLLGGGDGTARAAVVSHVLTHLKGAPPPVRATMAAALVSVLRLAEKTEGDHDAYASVAIELASELAGSITFEALLQLLTSPSAGARAASAAALAVHPDADRLVGDAELSALSGHAQHSLRAAARALLLRRLSRLLVDPTPLFQLLDSDWEDMRVFAAGLLERDIDTSHLSLDALVGLADATHVDVQDLAKTFIAQRLRDLPTQELLQKLLEHPHRNMRRFVLDLVRAHLKDGFVALAASEEFFRTVFLDVSPDRSIKRDAIAFLKQRGQKDRAQAEVALRLLSEVLKSKTVFDFELALDAVVHLKLAMHATDSPLDAPLPSELDEP